MDIDDFIEKLDSNSCFDVISELIFDITGRNIRLSSSGVPDHNYFEHFMVVLHNILQIIYLSL